MAHPARSFPSVRHRGSFHPPLLKRRLPYVPFPPQAQAGNVRNRASGMLFPKEHVRRFCSQQGSTLRHVSRSPQSASQQRCSPGFQPCGCTSSTSLVRDPVCLLHGRSGNANHSSTSPLPSPKWERGTTESTKVKFLNYRRTVRTCLLMPGEDLDTAARCALNKLR